MTTHIVKCHAANRPTGQVQCEQQCVDFLSARLPWGNPEYFRKRTKERVWGLAISIDYRIKLVKFDKNPTNICNLKRLNR